MVRVKAAFIHLLLSACVVGLVLVLMLFVWYPHGFFKLLGGGDLLYIIAGVDVCLGPLLTLAVFNPAKKSLKLDLAIIGLLQISALLYGAHVMFQSRPVFSVLEENLFKVTLASDFKDDLELNKASQDKWKSLSWSGPELVAAVAPTDPKVKQEMVFAAGSGADWNVFPKLFVSYDSQRQVALRNAKPLNVLKALSVENRASIERFEQKHPYKAYVYLPIVSGYIAMAAVLDAKNADFIEILDVETP
ncbi:TfpX/TfpZ family type IV pilin accessory protein [Methylotenera sp. 1P/1]|uniref:TfpX/TfpZ family type IV pilin accessory protein n=1 Tax=Methylotenera sp. 1P/1 TaxID=1131551 RepID=UPI000379D7BD|nr:TfpX/TfpZ family type IV pilin accessory protein [Methylotenera sp. 1P/1]